MPVVFCRALTGDVLAKEVGPGEAVEVEAAEEHEGVVGVGLEGDEVGSEGVVGHDVFVEGGAEGGEAAVREGEKGQVFDVGVVLGRVGDDVVDVVVVFPPADGEAADEVCDEDANARVDLEVVCYPHVSGVVDDEDQLVPDCTHEDSADGVPAPVQREEHTAEEEEVPTYFHCACAVVALV